MEEMKPASKIIQPDMQWALFAQRCVDRFFGLANPFAEKLRSSSVDSAREEKT
jgi:hypothetical protein